MVGSNAVDAINKIAIQCKTKPMDEKSEMMLRKFALTYIQQNN